MKMPVDEETQGLLISMMQPTTLPRPEVAQIRATKALAVYTAKMEGTPWLWMGMCNTCSPLSLLKTRQRPAEKVRDPEERLFSGGAPAAPTGIEESYFVLSSADLIARRRLRKQSVDRLYRFYAGQTLVQTLISVGEPSVIKAELLENCRVKFMNMDGVFDNVIAEVIGLAIDQPRL